MAAKATKDATSDFFDALASRGHEPLLKRVSGTLRFDLAEGRRVEHWYFTVKKGDVTVSRESVAATAVIRADKALFDGMAEGKVNAIPALLRGVLDVEGDLGLIMSFQRLFPGPPRSRSTPPAAGQAKKTR